MRRREREARHPFRASVELGLRTTPIMRDWLREQLAETDGER